MAKKVREANIKVGDMRAKDFFRFSFKKILMDLIISGLLVYLMFFCVPLYKNMFLREGFGRQIIDVIVNLVVYMIIFYTPSCYLSLKFFKGDRR